MFRLRQVSSSGRFYRRYSYKKIVGYFEKGRENLIFFSDYSWIFFSESLLQLYIGSYAVLWY